MRTISPRSARRLAVAAQRLTMPRPKADRESMLAVIRQLGCLQLDPVSAVTPSHRLVLWSRLGHYEQADLDRLLWEERRLFEYWAHAASIVLIEDYPIHRETMRRYRRAETPWARRVQGWVSENAALRAHVLREIRRRGPLPARVFEDRSAYAWASGGWNSGRSVDRMLAFLWMGGEVMVARRQGGHRWWDLSSRSLPDWTPRQRLTSTAVVYAAAQRSLRALGVARAGDINNHFIRGRYPGLLLALRRLERQGKIIPVAIDGNGTSLPGSWYVHAEDLALLDRIEGGDWQPKTTLLSPFDNLICDRARTRLLFGFDFSLEIYLPAARRRFGYYVLPVLHDDDLVGRIDVAMNRAEERLDLKAVHAEAGVEVDGAGQQVARAAGELASFLGARTVSIPKALPRGWRSALKSSF
ncbi:MAG TPA: crosslink repair DNA glycosylase YcaQ family protein [Candidatus Dormibacteraeota bacterium]|jgi:uncharacterized protein YcaQ